MVTEILKNYIPEHAEPLSEEQYAQLERYAELLVEWNEKMNLTAITDPEGIAVKHFLDCLAYLKRAKIPEGARVADVGTGAGFPGVVMKIVKYFAGPVGMFMWVLSLSVYCLNLLMVGADLCLYYRNHLLDKKALADSAK